MPNFTDLTGLASVASAMAASLLLLPWTKRLAKPHLAMLICSVSVVTLVPLGGLPLAAYVRGATGDLSITTMVLLWCALLRPMLVADAGCTPADSGQRLVLLSLIALTAVVFYPLALGFGTFDPYRLGYGNWPLLIVLLLFTLAAWFRRYHLIALCIALAVLAWAIGWYESGNLWDYLLDPFVSIYTLSALSTLIAKGQVNRLNKTYLPPQDLLDR